MKFTIPLLILLLCHHTHSFSRKDCKQLIKHITKRLQCEPSKYRKIIKTLYLILILLENGSKKSVEDLKSKISLIKDLTTFKYRENGVDRGYKSELNSKGDCKRSCKAN